MTEGANHSNGIDVRPTAAATAVVIGMVAMAAVAYLLLDILLVLFIGLVVAAALRPLHLMLCRCGVPKGLAVLMIYLGLLIGLVLIVLLVGPVLIEQVGTFVAEAPGTYVSARTSLQASGAAPLHFIGQRLPTLEGLTKNLTDVVPQLFHGALGLTTSIVKLPFYFVTVLVVAFYWTLEVPRFERLLLSLLAVERRPGALNVWHEIEAKLGGFMRGQGLAMLSIGVASGLGYLLIGLPHVLALAVLAGLLEAVPLIGPILAVGPAVVIALPLGVHMTMLVVGLALLLHLIESNVLIPRLMHHTVGVSAFVGLFAVLAFGTLYGLLGVLIAIPITAVIQVLLDSVVVNAEPMAQPAGIVGSPWEDLRVRVRALRQQARGRLRARNTRMGIDPASADHVVDAVDQEIEVAVARVEKLIKVATDIAVPLAAGAKATIVERLQSAMEPIEHVGTLAVPHEDASAASGATVGVTSAESIPITDSKEPVVEAPANSPETPPALGSIPEPDIENLDQATQRFKEAVQDVENLVVAAQEESRGVQAADELRHAREDVAPAIGPKRE